MEIEYVRFLNKDEKEAFFTAIKERNKRNKSISNIYIEAKKEQIISSYYNVEKAAINDYKKRLMDLEVRIEVWESKKCAACGSNLKLISYEYGQFWGCPRYLDKSVGNHSSFNVNFGEYIQSYVNSCKVKIPYRWVGNIRKSLKIEKKTTSTDVLNFLEENGLPDLRRKYNGKYTKESIGGFQKGKGRSIKEEKSAYEYFDSYYSNFYNIVKQQGILYKVRGDKERCCFVDLILSDQESVNIIEIKGSEYDVKEKQITLYRDLILHKMKEKKDERVITCNFLIFNRKSLFYNDHFIEFKSLYKERLNNDELLSKLKQKDFFKKKNNYA